MFGDWEIDEDGYPTEATLARLKAHRFEPLEARQFMLETFPAICEQIPCCSCDVIDATCQWSGAPEKHVEFSTGGWSGAEDLIYTLLDHFWVKQLHWSWRRGGHFVFRIPLKGWPDKVSNSDTLRE